MFAAGDFFLDNGNASDAATIQCLITRDIALKMAAWQLHVIHLDHTQTAIFATGLLLTIMIAWGVETLTGLWA